MADMPGEITGGTECYGRRYACGDPLTSLTQMLFRSLLVAFLTIRAHSAAQYLQPQLPIRSSC